MQKMNDTCVDLAIKDGIRTHFLKNFLLTLQEQSIRFVIIFDS